MTKEEYEQLKDGDYVDLTCRVIHMNGAKNFPTLIVGDQLITLTSGLMKAWATPSEKYVPRRKFRLGDLVRWKRREYLVETDEDAQERVYIVDTSTRHVKVNELQLLMTADEVKNLAKKGGSDE